MSALTKHRPAIVVGDIAYFPLTQGYVAVIDAADAPIASRCVWVARVTPTAIYAQASSKRQTIQMHRLLLDARPGEFVDHINGYGLDNRRANLRYADRYGNARNRRRRYDAGLEFKGIGIGARLTTRPYRARILVNGKRKCLGYYASAEEAARAYDTAAAAHHGGFARLNFPDDARGGQ